MNRKKIIIMISSLIVSGVIFAGIIALQNRIVNPYGTKTVFYASKPIERNTVITTQNVNNYFETKKISKSDLIDSPIINKRDLLNTYTKDDVLKGQQMSLKQLGSQTKRIKDIKDKREYSLKFSDIGDVVGGTLREGDVIDIIFTSSIDVTTQNVETKTVLKNILINKALSADGAEIKRNSVASATVLNLVMSAEDACRLDNAISRGKVKVMKVEDNKDYSDIDINSNTVSDNR